LPKTPQGVLSKFVAALSPTNWEHVTVNKQIDSVTMPKWVAVCILGAFLAFMGQSWWARSTDHDAMIEIKTELKLTKEALMAKQKEDTDNQHEMQAWREVMNGNLKEIKGMLSQQQLDLIDKRKQN